MNNEHAINAKNNKIISQLRRFKWNLIDWLEEYVFGFREIRNAYYYIKHRILQSHMIDTRISKGHWCDKTELILEGLLELVDDFVSRDKEDAFSTVDWSGSDIDIENKKNIIDVLHFKHIRRKAMEKEIEDLSTIYFEKYPMRFEPAEDVGPGYTKLATESDPERAKKSREEFLAIMDKEKKLEEETQRILHVIIDLRPSLWT